ncbi:MAG: hypothetical protein DLM59_20175 [Pseudonocardiales bacterium]|nr:MAG: hypothetical protein DLM59_20175 [Pseudonocardiales bacterium]
MAAAKFPYEGADANWGAGLVRARDEEHADAMRPTDEQLAEAARGLIREMQAQTDERRWFLDGDVPNSELPYHLLDGLPQVEPAAEPEVETAEPAIPTLLSRRARREANDPDRAMLRSAPDAQSGSA